MRVIDKLDRPGTTSRALVVQARTLELYRQLGFADELVERGLQFAAINLWVRGERVGRAYFGDIGKGLSPFPFMLIYPQDQHEELLIRQLRSAGAEVERNIELVDFDEKSDRIVARLQRQDGAIVEHEATYLAGCDGAHSRVRETLGIGFPGGMYERMFYVADVELGDRAEEDELHVAIDEADFIAIFPMKGHNVGRIIGTIKQSSEAEHKPLTWDDVSSRAVERMRITVKHVNWFSTYRVHHRVAESFRRGRAFLAGDAAHIHSPVGGQGMNTGIGDAVNVAWKLAEVLRGRAPTTLLDTYEPERVAFARRLVATTDRAFTVATADGPLARFARLDLVPKIFPMLMKSREMRRFAFRTVSQTVIDYRHSELSEGKAGALRGGDRLPWVPSESTRSDDNFTPLAALAWQLHVYGDTSPELAAAAARAGLSVHTFAFGPNAQAKGLARNAAYLVRPDGYIGLADPDARPERLAQYLEAHGIRATTVTTL